MSGDAGPPTPRPPTGTRERAGWWTSLPDPVAVIAVEDGRLLDVNDALETTSGQSRDALKGRPARSLVIAGHGGPLERMIRRAAEGETVRDEMDLVRPSRPPLPIELAAAPATTADGRPVVLLALRDISRRRAAEDEIHGLYREFALLHLVRERIGTERDPRIICEQVLEALSKILERESGALVYLDADGIGTLELLARRRVAAPVVDALGGARAPIAQIQTAFAERQVQRIDDLAVLEPGVAAPLRAAEIGALLLLPLRSPGSVHGVLVLCALDTEPFSEADTDLLAAVASETAMVLGTARLERQLRQSEARYRAMIEQSPLGILEIGVNGAILWANATAARLLGRDRDTLAGLPAQELYADPEDRTRLLAEFAEEPVILDRAVEFRRADGSPILVSLTSRHVPAGAGRPERYEDVIRDITGERELQEKLLRTEKLASLGQMISGIAHELNNPLTGVLGYAQLLQESELPAAVRDDVEKINADAMRCKRIIENLMRFARKERPRRDVVSVNEEVETVLELRRYQLSVADVTVERDLAPDLPYTMADPHQLQQVFLNLINNAADAVKEHRGAGRLRAQSLVHAGRIRVSIADDGPGIPPETLARIFDPFFTTKEVGKGTGLGLSVSYGIIREHGGEITVESVPGEGTTFHVDLPIERITPPEARARDTTRRLRVGGRGARVLVVDDEPGVLAVIQRTLDDDGYRTTGVGSVAAALEALGTESFDAIVTDLAMPEATGRDLHTRVAEHDPALGRRLVVLTGGALEPEIRNWLEGGGLSHLVKPFGVRELRKLVRRVIDGG